MLTDYKIKALIYPNGEYRFGKAVPVIDEGSFYRIDGTHIFDKYKICGIDKSNNRITLKTKDKNVVLLVE